ncbi:MAG: DCC1-like thiol-disulfide oxidoreductase family protein [Cyanobacteria bacterium J06621_12]
MNSSKTSHTNSLNQPLSTIFTLDLRSLVLLRIGLAAMTISDLLIRLPQIETYYSDAGILPRQELINNLPAAFWSFHLFNGSVFAQQMLFCLAVFFAGWLLIGYRTTLASIICWVMLISLHNRNPTLVSPGDDMLRIAMFWSLFLPLGAEYSSDRALNTSSKYIPSTVCSGATLSFILLLGGVYLRQLLNIAEANPVSWLSCFGWGLILIPWRNSWWRGVAIVLLLVLHLSQGVTTASIVMAFLWLALIPSQFWQLLDHKSSSSAARELIINYDRDCGFCKKVVYLLRTALILPQTKLLVAQDNPDIYIDMERYNSWVVEGEGGDRYFKWHGIAYVVSLSPILWWLAPILRIKPLMLLGNKVYETIANNRSLMGNLTKPLNFRSLKVHSSILSNIFTLLLMALILWSNFFHINYQDAALQFTRLDLPQNIF